MNPSSLTILYRGPLSSCNYDCHYCPFGKHHETAAELSSDQKALERFVERIESLSEIDISVFFTPWGEALTRRWYQKAIAHLSRMGHLRKVAIQTNLSSDLDWLEAADESKTGFWCTFHPSQVTRRKFLQRCRELGRRNVSYSVGMVGLKEDFTEMDSLRHELPDSVYFWINAYKDQPEYYCESEVLWLESLDPLFRTNTVRHESFGHTCRCGTSVISVDGDGTMRRCHFIKDPVGNFYDEKFAEALFDRPCSNQTCGCHIGYVHLDRLGLYPAFGDGILERVPEIQARQAVSPGEWS